MLLWEGVDVRHSKLTVCRSSVSCSPPATSQSGSSRASSVEEGAEAAEFKTGAVEEMSSPAQQGGDHVGGGTPVADPVTAAAGAITVGVDAFKRRLARKARRAAAGG